MRSPRPIPARPGPILSISSAASGDDAALARLLAPNLAVYLRALHDGLPLLFASLAPAPALDRFMALHGRDANSLGELPRLDAAWQAGSLNRSLAIGNYGVHYVRAARSRAGLAGCADLGRGGIPLRSVLDRTRWTGLHILDVRECAAGPAESAEMAADRLILPVHDLASLERAGQRLARLARDERGAHTARILIAGVDRSLRVSAEGRDGLGALRDEIARRRWPAYRSFLSLGTTPDVELGLADESAPRSVLHAAPGSSLHRQFRALAEEVSCDLALHSFHRASAPVEAAVPASSDAWRRLLLARRPRSLGVASSQELSARDEPSRAARPVRAVAHTLIRKGAL